MLLPFYVGNCSLCGTKRTPKIIEKDEDTFEISLVVCGFPKPTMTWTIGSKSYQSVDHKNKEGNYTYKATIPMSCGDKEIKYVVEDEKGNWIVDAINVRGVCK